MELSWAPSDVEGGSPSEVMGYGTSEDIRFFFKCLGEGVVVGYVVF